MRQLIRRLVSLPGSILGATASLCFASTQVWAQSTPGHAGTRPAATSPSSAPVPAIDGKVRNLVITGQKGDTLEITYANTGSSTTIIAGEVQVHVSQDSVAASLPFVDAQIVKPGETQRFRVPMPKLAKGRYMLLAIVDYGGETMTAAQAKLEIR
ncbi:MAG: hypothetical protein IPP90_19065 [Gemmatimonadaceae bacterium]|nr:hypothetical protein [Gemmatimonadaceae bacterium]